MPNFINYRKSISNELISTQNRVRDFIDGNQWGEDGRYKEIILTEKIKQLLPQPFSIGTGFVMCENNIITSQIDIIIYKNDIPLFFKKGNFVIVPKECVLGIIEVKTNITSSIVSSDLFEKAHKNGKLIGCDIFNGIFSFETGFSLENNISQSMSEHIKNNAGYINNISFGKDFFMKYWAKGNLSQKILNPNYSLYKIKDLSFGYFLSNLIEDVYKLDAKKKLPKSIKNSLYPIEESKEAHFINKIYV